jgi:ABC-type amino acid transport substrate-binding protein
MKMKKKILAILCAAVIAASLTACGSGGQTAGSSASGSAASSSSGAKFVMLDEPVSTEQYGIAFKKGNTALANTIKTQLDAMWDDGTFQKISDKWKLSDMSCYDQAKVATPDGTKEIADDTGRNSLTLGFDAEYPPYGYKDDNGKYVGYDIDLAQEVCNRLGWKLNLQPIDWDSKDMELDAGNIDVIWNGMTMTGREADYTWIGPYVDNSIVIVVKADSGITSLSDLAGKAVITQAGSSALTALTNDPGDGSNDKNLKLAATFSTLDQTPDYNTAFMNLESGVDDAVAVDIGVANYQLASRNG